MRRVADLQGAQHVTIRITVVCQNPRRHHVQDGILVQAVTVSACHRSTVGRNRDTDRGGCGAQAAVTGTVAEAVTTDIAAGRSIGKRAVAVERKSAMGRIAHLQGGQGITVRITVVCQHPRSCHTQCHVRTGAVAIAHGDRCAVNGILYPYTGNRGADPDLERPACGGTVLVGSGKPPVKIDHRTAVVEAGYCQLYGRVRVSCPGHRCIHHIAAVTEGYGWSDACRTPLTPPISHLHAVTPPQLR